MLTDSHCHPFDLINIFPKAEEERRKLNVLAMASSFRIEEFISNETLAKTAFAENAAPLLLCFGIHPQQFTIRNGSNEGLEILEELAAGKRISAIGECGFDLYNSEFRETEKLQDEYFTAQIDIALKYDLPVVIHARRAIHKIFACAKTLSKCKAVIFHSWSGTPDEAQALLRRGINVFFSFGNVIMLNHKQAIQSCIILPTDRLLLETDAPYQPRRTENFSIWADLPLILETAAALRSEAGNNTCVKELEIQIENNFRRAFI